MSEAWVKDRFDWQERILLEDRKLVNDCARRVALFLCVKANKSGEVWWGKDTIADALDVDERTIRNALKALIAAGYLSTRCGKHRGVKRLYQLHLPAGQDQKVLQFTATDRKDLSKIGARNRKDVSKTSERSFRPYKKEPFKGTKTRARDTERDQPWHRHKLRPVSPGSLDEHRWREWLVSNGLGSLESFEVLEQDGCLLLPLDSPPDPDQTTEHSIALGWFKRREAMLAQSQRASA